MSASTVRESKRRSVRGDYIPRKCQLSFYSLRAEPTFFDGFACAGLGVNERFQHAL